MPPTLDPVLSIVTDQEIISVRKMGPRSMNHKPLRSVAIFFMPIFYRPLGEGGESVAALLLQSSETHFTPPTHKCDTC